MRLTKAFKWHRTANCELRSRKYAASCTDPLHIYSTRARGLHARKSEVSHRSRSPSIRWANPWPFSLRTSYSGRSASTRRMLPETEREGRRTRSGPLQLGAVLCRICTATGRRPPPSRSVVRVRDAIHHVSTSAIQSCRESVDGEFADRHTDVSSHAR